MKLYERIENNNFDEIDKNRAIELIEGGNGHLVYNEDYFKLQKENEELNNRCRNLDKEAQAYLEELAGDNTLTRRTIKQLQEENEELKEERQIVGIPVRNKRDRRIGIVLHQWESGSVAVLESINPRVINTHDSWNTLEIVTDEVKQTPPPEPQLPTKTICESFSKKVRNK